MRKIFVVCLSLLIFAALALAQSPGQNLPSDKEGMVTRLKKEIQRLKNAAAKTKSKTKINALKKEMAVYQLRLDDLSKKISAEAAVPAISAEVSSIEVAEAAMPAEKSEEKLEKEARWRFEAGINGGVFAGGSLWQAETRFPLAYIFGPAKTTFRIAAGLAQSTDGDRKYLPLDFDLIFNLPPGIITGTQNYLGAGLNYSILTTGRKQGSFAGEIFYGVEGDGFNGKIFGEMGYSMLRTGFSPSQKGITLLIGYRMNVAF